MPSRASCSVLWINSKAVHVCAGRRKHKRDLRSRNHLRQTSTTNPPLQPIIDEKSNRSQAKTSSLIRPSNTTLPERRPTLLFVLHTGSTLSHVQRALHQLPHAHQIVPLRIGRCNTEFSRASTGVISCITHLSCIQSCVGRMAATSTPIRSPANLLKNASLRCIRISTILNSRREVRS